MGEKVCCGFGHREIFSDIKDQLYDVVVRLIKDIGVKKFYVGDNGEFDILFASAVRSAKKHYDNIKLYLVKPYITAELNRNKEYYISMYDDIIIPQELMGCHPKSAIVYRNRWMVDKSDYVIAFVPRGFGGAYTAVNYAKKNNKCIVHIDN